MGKGEEDLTSQWLVKGLHRGLVPGLILCKDSKTSGVKAKAWNAWNGLSLAKIIDFESERTHFKFWPCCLGLVTFDSVFNFVAFHCPYLTLSIVFSFKL